MTESNTNRDMEIPLEQVQAVLDLYEQGLYLQAYRASESWGPFSQWGGVRARILAGRLAANLGAVRQSHWLIRCAWRSDPSDAEARYYYGYKLWRTRGPLFAWNWIKQREELPAGTSAEIRSSWYALFGGVAGAFRDFDVAEQWMQKAEETSPESPWVHVCRSQLFESEDRYDESLQAAQRALAFQPRFRPALQAAAHALSLLDRDEEAIALLDEAALHLESNAIFLQLYQIQIELKRYEQAKENLERAAELSPLAEKDMRYWLAAQRSELAYRLGDFEAAIRYARESDSGFFKTVADRLEDPARAEAPCILLPVGFVRQHHVTCVPATLSAISRYWSMPADHLQVADEICYNGTSAYSERKWAREHGWSAIEFTVTEPAAAALIERGVPFTFTTIEPGSAHVQAVIGYDGRRGTVMIRDPYYRNANEGLADKVLQRYRAYGPRGMALVPEAQRDKLEGLDLPDASWWDRLHALDGALVAHRRDEADQIYAAMRETEPDHLLTREARRRLSIYDQNPAEHLAAVERLLEVNSEDQSLQLERLSCLRDLTRRDERLSIYEELCARSETHPIFYQQYAQELRSDARRHDDAIWLLRRGIRRWPTHAANYYVLANLYWDQRRFDEALDLYRIAACLDDKEEQFSHAYFATAVSRNQSEQALDFLRRRFERFGGKSGFPARTLYAAYTQLDRNQEALEAIDAAARLRPDDGELLLFAADAYAACSLENLARAEEMFQEARDKSPPGSWLRTAARMAACDGRLDDALESWMQVLRIQPLAIDAHRAMAQLLAETQGRAAALEHLRQAAERFPHLYPLHELHVESLREEPPEVSEAVIRQAIAAYPDDGWLRRELALVLSAQRRFQEAWQQLDLAGQLDPQHPSYFLVRAHVLRQENRIDEAKRDLQRVIEMSVDNELAISEWIDLSPTIEERRQVLEFVKGQLERQIISGDGLLAFSIHARDSLEPTEALALLADAWRARPDLWQAWVALIGQHRDMNQLDEAWQLVSQATQRFPLVPRLWLDRGELCRVRGDAEGELQAIETAYRINPDWGTAVRMLCDLHERRGEYDRSRQLLERAVARNPLDVGNHLRLADLQWRHGDREAALQRVQKAVETDPGFEPAWERLNAWSDELDCPERALEVAGELTERRGGEARSWLMLAKLLDAREQSDERLKALDRAIELDPRNLDAYDLRALTLAADGRWEEALESCRPPVWQDHPPAPLRARAAWLEAQRGDLPSAIERMREIVQDEPYFYEAWSQLSEWHLEAEQPEAGVEAAEAMVRIRPHSEISFGYLGDARLAAADRAGAIQAYRRAIELNAGYEYAGYSLFDLALEDEDFSAADATLAMLRKHTEGPLVTARAVQLAAKTANEQAACAALEETCVVCQDDPTPLNVALGAMLDAGWQADAERVLGRAVDAGSAHLNVMQRWAYLRGLRNDAQCVSRLRELAEQSDDGQRATHGYIDGLFDAGGQQQAGNFVRENSDWLRAHTFTWGAGGYALTRLRRYRDAADWHADWRDRPDAEPWMLVNVVESLRAMGRDAEALQATQRALSLPPGHGQHLHHLWLAVDAACAGDLAAAREHLDWVPPESLDEDYQFDWMIVTSVLRMAEAAPAERSQVFADVRRQVAAARKNFAAYAQEPARQRFYHQALAEIARYRGTWAARLWYLVRRAVS